MAKPVVEIREKITRYCVYQERSWREVNDKLAELDCPEWAKEELCAFLITEGYVNEERFCRIFVRSKFHQLSWGKLKIRFELKKHQVSAANLKIALAEEIPEDENFETAQKVAKKKLALLSKKNSFEQKNSLYQFLQQKGYEQEVISSVLAELFP